MRLKMIFLMTFLASAPALGADYLTDPGEVDAMLRGASLEGLYLRNQSTYRLQFQPDGTLVRQGGGEGRWWVNEQGQYCREWLSGRLKGNTACLDLAREGDGVAMYSRGRKVAEGKLVRD